MDKKIKYISEKYNKDKTEIIAYKLRIVSPKHSQIRGVEKVFSKKRFENAFEAALEYLNTNEECQILIKEYERIYENNMNEWLKDCYKKIPKIKTDEPHIYKNFSKTAFGYKQNGYLLQYRSNNNIYRKIFTFFKYKDPFKEAIKFRDTDLDTIKNLSMQKNKKILSIDKKLENYLLKCDIKKFPVKINGIKYIGIDIINDTYYLIKECKCCHKHINVLIYKKEEGSPFCNSCSWSNLKNAKYYSLRNSKGKNGSSIITIQSKITVGKNTEKKNLIRFNIILNSKKFNENDFLLAKEINILYTKFLLDDFIKTHKLKYPLHLDNKVFLEIKNKTILNYGLIRQPKSIIINLENLKDPLIYKQYHIFKAKIQGFGTNKKDLSKTVLLNEVEYVGIDNFRDHMWTQFTKKLDLPIGTTIKFKGAIYDYEREYLGTREADKNGQAIEIIDLLEVDLSTRERVKLYK